MQIEQQIQIFLAQAGLGKITIDDKLIEEFGERCKSVFKKQLVEPREDKFRLRMSNIGRPLCILQMDKQNEASEPRTYDLIFKSLFGDLTEAALLTIIKASGIEFNAQDLLVSLDLPNGKIKGTLDAVLYNKVWDIKTCSVYAFENKFSSFERLQEGDTFGYIKQLVGYSKALGLQPGGWIALCKETGEVRSLAFPEHLDLEPILTDINSVITDIDKPFKKLFEDKPEKFRNKDTGNRVLDTTCRYCSHKAKCWPSLEIRPSIPSKSFDRELTYYTFIDEKYKEQENESE